MTMGSLKEISTESEMSLGVSVILLLLLTEVSMCSVSQYVVAGAIEIFDGNISPSSTKDVLESTLYSQMLANHAYDKFSDFSLWYDKSIKIYQEIGWTLSVSEFDLHVDNISTSRDESIISLISSNIEKADKEYIQTAFNSLLENYTVAKMFSQESLKGNFSNFQILMLKLDDEGDIIMSYIGVVADVLKYNLRELFVSFGLGILKENDYSVHREGVSTYLGNYASSRILTLKT